MVDAGDQLDSPDLRPSLRRFLLQLRAAPAFPLKQGGVFMVVIGGAIIFSGRIIAGNCLAYMKAMMRGSGGTTPLLVVAMAIAALALLGYMCLYVMAVVGACAKGDDRPPNWPDITSLDETVQGFLMLTGVLVICLGPALFLDKVFDSPPRWLYWSLFVAGAIASPMGLLAVSLHDTLSAMNPLLIAGGIVKCMPAYLACVWLFPAIYLLTTLADGFSLASLAVAVAMSYLLMLGGCVLGLLYRTHTRRLDWFPDAQL
jgi:hypothetical protein